MKMQSVISVFYVQISDPIDIFYSKKSSGGLDFAIRNIY